MSLFSHPIKKFIYLSAFAGGYVFGAKAGRERYEQILQAAGQVKDDPRVQQAAEKAEDLATEAATKVAESPQVKEAASKAKDAASDAASKTKAKASKAASAAKPKPTPKPDDTKVDTTSPLLADEHVGTDEEVVYSTGPDIEETVDELAPGDDSERL
jgi:sRNA-binding protein